MKLAQLFTDNYEYLNTVAKRITRSRDHRMAPDLLNSTYLTVHEKHEKGMYVPYEGEEFVKWFSKCMKNYFTWPNSAFNDYYSPRYSLSLDDSHGKQDNSDYCSVPIELVDPCAHLELELFAENTNDNTRELMAILNFDLEREDALKYLNVLDFVQSLEKYEKELFSLYFEKKLSTRKIAEMYSMESNTINYQSINIMVNKIKSKIEAYPKFKSSE